MNVIYEEEGQLKAGTIVLDQINSLQLDSTHGKRVKIKSTSVLLRFDNITPLAFLEQAQSLSNEIDLELLWEFSGENEFNFQSVAHEYFGHTPSALESASILLKLHQEPIYFYKKGKGKFKSATPEAVQSAFASIERKKQEAILIEEYTQSLLNFQIPNGISNQELNQLIYNPDRNSLIFKALQQVHTELNLSRPQLLLKCGIIKNIYEYHYNKFILEHFSKNKSFENLTEEDKKSSIDFDLDDLEMASVKAFSIDDSNTTEIDDAFSLEIKSEDCYRIGIHIAIPALGLLNDSPLDLIAKQRLSTVYIPSEKITMLPDWAIDLFTLKENQYCPAMSLYIEVNPKENYKINDYETCIEKVFIEANLRHEALRPVFNEQTVVSNLAEIPKESSYAYEKELLILFQLSKALEALRGKTPQERKTEYAFVIDKENDKVNIIPRLRGDPVDKVVEELMVLANSYWAEQLDNSKFLGLYRSQENGKVRMTTTPGRHQGLGVERYMWSTSPIRRYVDLINQRQLISWVYDEEPFYSKHDANLFFEIIRGFETVYVAYSNFQRSMERYWCLRWLLQENIKTLQCQVIKENTVRATHLPLTVHVSYLPDLPANEIIELKIDQIDLLDLNIDCHYE